MAEVSLKTMWKLSSGFAKLGQHHEADGCERRRRKADAGNLAKAQDNLGWMYRHGRGVPQDDAEAIKWFRRAVENGYPAAQTNLN